MEIGRKFIIENLPVQNEQCRAAGVVEELDVLITFMESRPSVRIRVEGHTDNTGSMRINMALSEKRAEGVKAYLVQKGVDARRMQVVGYGPKKPIASNKTDFGRRLNRRTEIVITAK